MINYLINKDYFLINRDTGVNLTPLVIAINTQLHIDRIKANGQA